MAESREPRAESREPRAESREPFKSCGGSPRARRKIDPQGIYFGGNDMFLTPRDMLKIGQLYLDGGLYKGRQIVPRAWVDSSLVPRTVSPWNGNRYGYGWWTRTAHGVDIRYAWGYGGQFIFVVPALELVVVMTSESESRRDGGHNGELHRILEDAIIPAVSNR